jgi:aspartate aminotransferase-like enzyme
MIKKQRLLTPGPTPLYPKALYAMLGADMHHRTDDFRAIYKGVLADLKEPTMCWCWSPQAPARWKRR